MSGSTEDGTIAGMLAGIGQLVLPFARIYVGPAAKTIEHDQRDAARGERRLLMVAMHKLIVEAGTLPSPETAYAPHDGVFVLDEKGSAPALDLRYLLAALRALAAWASAGPANDTVEANTKQAETTSKLEAEAQPSARALRSAARARGYASTAAASATARRGGCGCRGARTYSTTVSMSSSYSTSASSSRRATPRRRVDCEDPKPRCDCGGTCGGSGCGCAGTESCVDCIPRGAHADDLCASACTCPPQPEECTPWTPSCETRNRLRACLKDVLCELLACLEQYLCDATSDPVTRRAELERCLVDLLCKLLRCIREALCPPPKSLQLPSPPPVDCLPCSYAVEEQ